MNAADTLIHDFFRGVEEAGLDALVLGRAYDERAPEPLRLQALAPFARAGLLLVSGGSAFFEGFLRSEVAGPDPLDAYTRRLVTSLVEPLTSGGVRARVFYPFWNEENPLPFQAIARGAGLAPSLLGLDLHPRFGPWMAYRALLVVDRPLAERPLPPFDPCAACPAPCIEACPVGAVGRGGWDARACFGHRQSEGGCAEGCHARIACPVGAEHRYADHVLRFFQASALGCATSSKS